MSRRIYIHTLLFGLLICCPFVSEAQFSARFIAPFTKVFSEGTPFLLGPSVQIEFGLGGGGRTGAKSRVYLGGFYNLINLGKINVEPLLYEHYLLNGYIGYAYYFSGDIEAPFSTYALGEYNFLYHGIGMHDDADLQGVPPDTIASGTKLTTQGVSVGIGIQFKGESKRTSSNVSVSGSAIELKFTLPFNSTPEEILAYGGNTYKGSIKPYMELKPFVTISYSIIMP